MQIVFPSSLPYPRKPNEAFVDEYCAFLEAGFSVALDKPSQEGTFLYRGWMMHPDEYKEFIENSGATPFTTHQQYLNTHYLPNWYSILQDLTPETVVFPPDANLRVELEKLGWGAYFIKDYVKSVKPARIIRDLNEIDQLVREMITYREMIEGGFCVRRVEDFFMERRFFVVHGTPYGKTIPPIVHEVAKRIDSPFYSVDVAMRTDAQFRIVEIGDGQVSGFGDWKLEDFVDMWRSR